MDNVTSMIAVALAEKIERLRLQVSGCADELERVYLNLDLKDYEALFLQTVGVKAPA